jgi:hypothetical protein
LQARSLKKPSFSRLFFLFWLSVPTGGRFFEPLQLAALDAGKLASLLAGTIMNAAICLNFFLNKCREASFYIYCSFEPNGT